MTKNLITVTEEEPLLSLLQKMVENRLSGLPVIKPDGTLVGFVPNTKVLQKLLPDLPKFFLPLEYNNKKIPFTSSAQVLEDYLSKKIDSLKNLKVKDIMIEPSHKLKKTSSFLEAIEAFISKGINRIGIVDENDKLIGVICRNNILSVLYEQLKTKL